MLKVAFHEDFIHPLPEGHKFPMEKYELLPFQLLHEGTLEEANFFKPEIAERSLLETIHTSEYLSRLFKLELTPREQRVSGFPHSTGLIEREARIMEGTRKCAELALTSRAAMNIAGGTHHAYTDRGEGFCLMNDQAIAARWLLDSGKVSKILIIDLDVHQGNGTAQIFRNDPNVFTFSMHGRNNYPLKKEMSDLDVELEDGTKDAAYLDILNRNIDLILNEFKPDFLFYQSGVDILESDKLGRLSLSLGGCKKRDEMIVTLAKDLQLPIVCSMGGGYSPEVKDIVEAHSNTYRVIQNILF
ncbi:MAG: acetoin utilization deacetylase AcuC-like enzyme [Crocinitomicaceae bacterium]|jgi:acetoin utilization deacetylase AcuC-like enzyme